MWGLDSNLWTKIPRLYSSPVAKIFIFKCFVLVSWTVHFQAHKGEGRKESGPNVPIGCAWGNFVSLQQFFADLEVVVTGFAKSNIRCPWPSECDSRFFGETVDLAVQDYHIGSAPWVSAGVWGITGASRPSQKDLGKGGSKRKSGLWTLIHLILITFYSKRNY